MALGLSPRSKYQMNGKHYCGIVAVLYLIQQLLAAAQDCRRVNVMQTSTSIDARKLRRRGRGMRFGELCRAEIARENSYRAVNRGLHHRLHQRACAQSSKSSKPRASSETSEASVSASTASKDFVCLLVSGYPPTRPTERCTGQLENWGRSSHLQT